MNRGLFLASEAGDLDEIQRLHKQNKDVLLERTFQRDTALHIATRNGHLNVVEWILGEEPCLAKARNKVKKTPLHEAAKSGNLNLVKFLLEHKPSSKYHSNKRTLRDFLEDTGKVFLLRVMVPQPDTPLMIASQYRHLGIVEFLLEPKSSEYRVTPREWHRSIREAAYRGYEDIVVVLLDKKVRVSLDHKILHRAVEGGHMETVVALLNHSSWRNEVMTKRDTQERCPVHVAAMKGSWEMIKEFKSRMPDSLEIRCPNQKSLLHLAVEYRQFDVAKYLLENVEREKAEEMVCNDYDCSHNTPLHWASTNGVSPQLLDLLLSFGSDNVNAVNDEAMTALDIALAAAQDNPNCANIAGRLKAAGGIRSSLARKSITNTTAHTLYRYEKGIDKDTVNTHMVVASLIATITFAAMFQIPGGIEDDKESIHYGAAKLAFNGVFKVFLFSDTVAFVASLTVVGGLLLQQHWKESHCESSSTSRTVMSNLSEASLLVSIITTVVAFLTATILVITPDKNYVEAFNEYFVLRLGEVILAIFTPFSIAMILHIALAMRIKKMHVIFVQIFLQIGVMLAYISGLFGLMQLAPNKSYQKREYIH